MVEIASFVLQGVVKFLAAPFERQFKYLYDYDTNFINLEKEVAKLKNTRDKVQVKVDAAERNVEEVKQNVKVWQTAVDSIIYEAEKLIEEKGNNPRCFNGLFPNLKTCYKHSKKAFKLKENDISQILDMDFKEVSYPYISQNIWLRSNEDYLFFESRNSIVKNVLDALNDDNIYLIGVYGMGGLGKTRLVQEVGRRAEKHKLFDEIVFVQVTQTPDLKEIQTRIVEMLGLKFQEDQGQIEIAKELYSRMQEKKILLILDNIWEELDLMTIGIPSGSDHGRSKILMTTRNVDVLERMGSTNDFRMNILNDEEAWSLFKKMAGDVIQTRELNYLSNEVCKECGGLPLAIITVAKTLRNKRQKSQWEEALRNIRMPSPTKFTRLLEEEYSIIKLSYDYLENDELKKTFIISSLMENDTSISDLFKNIVSLGILEGANLTIEQVRNKLDLVVKKLKDSCLLFDGRTKGSFSMHDVIRSVALTCAYTYYYVFTERNDIEREWKDKNKLRKCTIISSVGNDFITQLWPEGLDCPELEFFYMSKRGSLFEIPENFFTMMSKLKVLNLRSMRRLPPSLELLINLQTLCLDYSEIKDVAIIGKLRKLQVLSLQGSDIKELTIEIGQLTQLRLLDLSNCWRLEVIVPNVISKLSQLEELHIKGCPIQWKVEVLEELKGLSQLTSLELDIKDNKMLPKDFFSKELRRYKISIGDWPFRYVRINQDESLRVLKFKFNSIISLEEFQGIKNVEILLLAVNVDNSLDELQSNITPLFNEKLIFSDLMTLELKDYCSRKIWDNQLPTFMSSSYQNLKQLTLQRCRNIEYAFPFSIAKCLMQLQYLEIMDGKILKEIVAKEEGPNAVVNFVFPNVTLLKLENLPELTAFYPERHTSKWPKLKELVVINCDKLTSKHMSFQENSEEVELNISNPNAIFLDDKINSHLEKMELQNKNRGIEWQSQSKVLKIRHDVSTNISFELLQTFENLNELQLSFCDQYKEIKCLFDPPNLEVLDVSFCYRLMSVVSSSTSFQNLKVLRVNSCNGLMMNVITPSMARSLVQLREMRIKYCQMVIEIVENEGDATTTTTEIVFDNLKKLSIIGLDSLTCFCSGNYSFNFPYLEDLIIRNCPNMNTFSKGILSTPKLQKVVYLGEEIMDLESGRELNTIIQEAHEEKVYFNLKKLTLALSGRDILSIWQGEFQENFGKVKTLQFTMDNSTDIPIRILQKFNSLEKLILKMSSYEKIFSSGEDEEPAGTLTKLKVLELQGLLNLKCIWKQDSRLNSILQNLDRLKVQYCHNLMTLLPSSTSFENLTTLTITYCNGMQNLMSSSTAKSLERLEYLLIERCEMMMEVLANEGDLEKDEIVFEKLKELCFYSLENLTCFCYGDYILEFPVLESLDVNECSKMKTFSRGGLSMPRLQELNGRDCSKSDLNTITQQLQNDCSELWERFPGF